MFVKIIKKIVTAKKLILLGLMLSFGATVRPASWPDEKLALYNEEQKRIRKSQNKKLINQMELLLGNRSHYYGEIELCIYNGADVNHSYTHKFGCNERERTPLCMAAERGYEGLVNCLLKNNALVDLSPESDSVTPLELAAINGHTTVVSTLVDARANINTTSVFKQIPLHSAASNGHLEIVKYLIGKGSNINKPDENGKTPIYMAAQNRHLDIVKYFIEQRAQINQPDDKGITPINIAARSGHLDIVKYLEGAGEKITDLQEPLLKAIQNGKVELVNYLVEKRADVNYIPKNDRTALYWAADYGFLEQNKEIIERLIAAGADPSLAGPNGVTPFFKAIQREYPEAVSILLDAHCLRLIAPLCQAVKNSDAATKRKDGSPQGPDTLNASEISALEKLPIECLEIIMQNLSPKSITRFRQASRTCKNAAEYENVRQLRNTITLKQQDFRELVKRAMAGIIKNREDGRENQENNATIVALLQAASQRDLWQVALEAQPVCTNREIMSDAQYEESCAEYEKSRAEYAQLCEQQKNSCAQKQTSHCAVN